MAEEGSLDTIRLLGELEDGILPHYTLLYLNTLYYTILYRTKHAIPLYIILYSPYYTTPCTVGLADMESKLLPQPWKWAPAPHHNTPYHTTPYHAILPYATLYCRTPPVPYVTLALS